MMEGALTLENFFNIVLFPYLIGSIPFGFLLTKFSGMGDIRQVGSGNIGATNVLRTGNKGLAAATLILDALKCVFVIFLYNIHVGLGQAYFEQEFFLVGVWAYLLIVFFAILGHCYPIWLKFKGGKGVATALGGLLAAVPVTGLAACGLWLASAFLFKISSLAALIAIGLTPLITFVFYGLAPAGVNVLITALIFWRHKDNIGRLRKGEEPKIGDKKS